MRNLAIYCLLTLFAFAVGGSYLVDALRLMANGERVASLMVRIGEDVNAERIALTNGNAPGMCWTSDHEFRKDGVLYDVVKTESSGDTVFAVCVRDQDEDAIDAHIAGQVERNGIDAESHTSSHHVVPESPVKEFPIATHRTVRNHSRRTEYISVALISLLESPLNIPTPPPRG